MVPCGKNWVVEYRPDNSKTGGGGWYRDSTGNWWELVDGFGPDGTNSKFGYLHSDGQGNQWITRG
jgi:hypothetical protein